LKLCSIFPSLNYPTRVDSPDPGNAPLVHGFAERFLKFLNLVFYLPYVLNEKRVCRVVEYP